MRGNKEWNKRRDDRECERNYWYPNFFKTGNEIITRRKLRRIFKKVQSEHKGEIGEPTLTHQILCKDVSSRT